MKPDKKDNLIKKQKYAAIINRNRQLTKANIVILGAGLLLMLVGIEEVGSIIVWVGIVIFIFTLMSNITAKLRLRKLD